MLAVARFGRRREDGDSRPDDERPNLRANIDAYGFGGMPLGEQPWGYERRSGSDRRRQRPEQRFPERRSGVDRRSGIERRDEVAASA